jgi:CcmD family protein
MGAAIFAVLPALPLHEAGKYVAGAYVVVFALVLIYVAIMAIRLSRIERELGELIELGQPARPEEAAAPRAASRAESTPA